MKQNRLKSAQYFCISLINILHFIFFSLSLFAVPPTVDIKSPRSFLKHHLHYQLPTKFDCNVLDNVLAFVLHVANVQPDSLQTLKQQHRVHLQFASMGTGYYPTYYAFLVELPQQSESESPLHIVEIEADASDDNVVLRLHMSEHCETLPSYLAGTDSNDLKQYAVRGQYNENEDDDQKQQQQEEEELKKDKQALQINAKHDEVEQALEVTIVPQGSDIEAEVLQQQQQLPQQQEEEQQKEEHHEQHEHLKKPNKKQRKRNKRSLSESACEDIKAAHEEQQEKQKEEQQQQQQQQLVQPQVATLNVPKRKQRSYSECHESSSVGAGGVHRGILKRFSRYGPRPSISDSCSSIDDCTSSYSCSVDGVGFSQSFGGIPEERGGDDVNLSESCKKTVRFNDHILKQTFR